jgi:hypothetical protein
VRWTCWQTTLSWRVFLLLVYCIWIGVGCLFADKMGARLRSIRARFSFSLKEMQANWSRLYIQRLCRAYESTPLVRRCIYLLPSLYDSIAFAWSLFMCSLSMCRNDTLQAQKGGRGAAWHAGECPGRRGGRRQGRGPREDGARDEGERFVELVSTLAFVCCCAHASCVASSLCCMIGEMLSFCAHLQQVLCAHLPINTLVIGGGHAQFLRTSVVGDRHAAPRAPRGEKSARDARGPSAGLGVSSEFLRRHAFWLGYYCILEWLTLGYRQL